MLLVGKDVCKWTHQELFFGDVLDVLLNGEQDLLLIHHPVALARQLVMHLNALLKAALGLTV